MPDRRSIDELSTEEIERALAIRKRQERNRRLRRLAGEGRIAPVEPRPAPPASAGAAAGSERRSSGRYRAIEIGEEEEPRPERRGLAWGWMFNKVLLLIELLALAGLVLVVANSFFTWRELNADAIQARPTPTLPVRPLIDVFVLPEGHRPPSDGSEAQPNLDEIPPHLRGLVQAVTPQPMPTRGPEQASRLAIRTLNIDSPVVEGDDWEQLKKGVGHHIGTANPGERGNMVLAGHNDVYGQIFRDLEKIELKDEILVYSGNRVFRYVATQKRVIEPTEVSVMYPTSEATLTLITCYPYLVDNKRLVVIAELQP